jgi:hypothetical protein
MNNDIQTIVPGFVIKTASDSCRDDLHQGVLHQLAEENDKWLY